MGVFFPLAKVTARTHAWRARLEKTPPSGALILRPVIQVEHVSHVYGDDASSCVALRDISLSLHPRSFAALAGPSGSGKTTLLHIVAGLERPTSGRVRIDGTDLQQLHDDAQSDFRLSHIGFVFHDMRLIPVLSAIENVELPLLFRRDLSAADRRQRARDMLNAMGVECRSHRRPGELSAGERQRVALARALAGGPRLILADEPTANLDAEAGDAIIELMLTLSRERGATVLCATHDTHLIMRATATVRLRHGALVESAA